MSPLISLIQAAIYFGTVIMFGSLGETLTEKSGNLVGVKAVGKDDEVMLITTEGIIIRMECSGISVLGRITSGVKLINLQENSKVASIAKVRETQEESEEEIQETEVAENN